MEEVKKNFLYENGYFINIEITSDKLNKESVNALDNLFSEGLFTTNIINIIYMINVIIKGSQKNKVHVVLVNNDIIESLVDIKDNKIVSYYSEKMINNKKDYEVKYSSKSGYNFRIFDEKNAQKIVNTQIEIINNIENRYVFPLTDYDKKIINVFNIVFGYQPDFSRNEDREKCKYLLFILKLMHLSIDNIDFDVYNDIIYSDELDSIFNKIAILGKCDEEIILSDEYIQKLNLIKNYLKTNEHELYLLAMSLNKKYYLGNENNEIINDLSTSLGR
ncbi:MAG: hypothetical protein PUD07_00485 [bacterium]|nr:hypothetical protein [bacterium]